MNDLDFIPMRGHESTLLAQTPQLGVISFATDTGKMYMDVVDDATNTIVHKAIGGSGAAILYAEATLSEPEPDRTYRVSYDTIKDLNGIPNVNDLIINLSDGKFLKIASIEETACYCDLIAVSGTGGGGDGPSSSSKESLKLSIPKREVTMLYNSDYDFEFNVYATDEEGNPVYGQLYPIQIKVGLGRTELYSATVYSSPEIQSFPLGEALKKVSVTPGNRYGLTFTATYYTVDGGKREPSMSCGVTLVSLTFTPPAYEFTKDKVVHGRDKAFTLEWSLAGQLRKISKVYADNQLIGTVNTDANSSAAKYTFNANHFTHGHHVIKITTEGWIDDITKVDGPTFEEEYLFVEKGSDIPVMACRLKKAEIRQYDTLRFPILIYTDNNPAGKVNFDIYENYPQALQIGLEGVSGTPYEVNYSPKNYGKQILTLISGVTRRDLEVTVDELKLTNVSEKEGYTFKFSANDFIGDQGVRDWKFKVNGEDKSLSFSENFDWWNGGLTKSSMNDGNEGKGQYLRIKSGNSVTIPYPLFAKDATTNGKSIKIICKVHNCKDYESQFLRSTWDAKTIHINDTKALTNILQEGETYNVGIGVEIINNSSLALTYSSEIEFNEDNFSKFEGQYVQAGANIYQCYFDIDDAPYYYAVTLEEGELGLILKAHEGVLQTPSGKVGTQYCEDAYIEMEFDISRKDSTSAAHPKNYIKTWIDGVPTGVMVYSRNMVFRSPDTNNIVIGSADCDVDIYLIKIYETTLTDEEHIQNFIVDAPNAAEIINRYDRNNILIDPSNSAAGISYTKLALANPDCLVHLYDIAKMTKTKKDPQRVYKYEQYHNSNLPILAADDITFKVQGTSSQKYVEAAANLDTDFADATTGNTKFYDPQNNNKPLPPEGWSMSKNAIPVNFFCTKVNVASCENGNNAVNQEWYNLFQPYQSLLRFREGKTGARDTMEFTNGVIFIKDRNPDFNLNAADPKTNNVFGEISGYMSKDPAERDYRFYSLGQMGNSKDNIHVFHDTSNPKECCIEVKDNQEPQQWMITDNYGDGDVSGGKEYYEFRYPEDDFTKEMLDGWRRLVTWMAHSNPQPKYEKHTLEGTSAATDFTNLLNKYSKVYYMNTDRTDYIEISDYSDSIVDYYVETPHVYGYTNLKLPEYTLSYDILAEDNKTYYTFNGETRTYEQANEIIAGQDIRSLSLYELVQKNFGTEYKFKGYKADETLQANYIPVVKDIQFTHAGSYEYDTYEYRIAKMVYECENYLVMDSILYHYLFIERHSMIDNVAKNTFWSSEDCKHWNLVKDYDNDTADGNDNNGQLTVPYGSEAFDVLPNGRLTFNASKSVWLNFIYGIPSVCEAFYQKMESEPRYQKEIDGQLVSCWDKQAYLKLFTDWQSRIPERCWVEDYYRKYLRPYELYGTTTFLPMLEGGQKKYQRLQYETYQSLYISSKYKGKEVTDSCLQLRTGVISTTEAQPAIIPVKLYSDGYFLANKGGQWEHTRLKRNAVGEVVFVGDFNNATFDIYPASQMSMLCSPERPLEQIKPDLFNPTVGLSKMREITIGTKENNTGLNSPFTTFSLGQAPLLEHANLAHISYAGPLSLTNCSSLITLDATGSNFTDIALADGAPTTTIKLQQPSTLELSNLRVLNTLEIGSYNSLNNIQLTNIDSRVPNLSKNIVQRSSQLVNYNLQEINWTIDNTTEIKDDNTITALEFLINKAPTGIALPTLLSGHILVTENTVGYNPKAIYDRYVNTATYPLLDIEFSEGRLPKVEITSPYSQEVWYNRITKNDTTSSSFFANGPTGAYSLQSVVQTVDKEYVFQNRWEVYDLATNNKIMEVEGEWPSYRVTGDVRLVPIYSEGEARKYIATFLNDDGSLIESKEIAYGTKLTKEYLPLTPKATAGEPEEFYYTYGFDGYTIYGSLWTEEELANYEIKDHVTLTAAYKKVHVYINPLDASYFDLTGQFASTQILGTKEGIKLTGKITIPRQLNGQEVKGLHTGAFQHGYGKRDTNGITHIFFEADSFENSNNFTPNQTFNKLGQLALSVGGAYIELPPNITEVVISSMNHWAGDHAGNVFILSEAMTAIPPSFMSKAAGKLMRRDAIGVENDNVVELLQVTKIGALAFESTTVCANVELVLGNNIEFGGVLNTTSGANYKCKVLRFKKTDTPNLRLATNANVPSGVKLWKADEIILEGETPNSDIYKFIETYFDYTTLTTTD